MSHCILEFRAGTLLCSFPGETEPPVSAVPYLLFDERVGKWRAQASDYAALMRAFHASGTEVRDEAKAYQTLELNLKEPIQPMPHQKRALEAWKTAVPPGRGVVVMPTGSGKTFLAILAIASVKRSALIVVPTIDLVHQWASVLERFFEEPVGMLGGGSKEIREITVSTYDSAVIMMEHIGNRFGIVVFDECHHLPGEVNRTAAAMCIAPYRLGLSATPEREDGGEAILFSLVGPKVCEIFIDELEGNVLAPYVTRRIEVPLLPDEEAEYHEARALYTGFIRANRIDFSAKDGWSQFIILCARRPNGRDVMKAYLRQRSIARCGRAKLNVLWDILMSHRGERTIIFTADNDTAYTIGETFCLPVITHKTKAAERKEFLDRFREGIYTVIVTSKVLNEGVDVPEAAVGIVVSGSGSTREHVQRLGRILRSAKGKQAELFELVSQGTGEYYTSERRRSNRAYRRKR
ncbi:MAG: DEAD/DEAH box helicase family protein [Lentisphaeria bacterium]|nr:DEAD/DEAH box helicase family protein [Lentisphaeria bacterium]